MLHQKEWHDLLIYLSGRRCRALACMRLERLARPWPEDTEELQKAMNLAGLQGLHEFFLLYVVLAGAPSRPGGPA